MDEKLIKLYIRDLTSASPDVATGQDLKRNRLRTILLQSNVYNESAILEELQKHRSLNVETLFIKAKKVCNGVHEKSLYFFQADSDTFSS